MSRTVFCFKRQVLRGRSVEIVRSNVDFADLQWTHDIRLHRDHILLVLKLALDQQEFAVGDNAAVLLIDGGSNDCVGDSRLIFQAQEHESLGGSRPLPGDHASCDPSLSSVFELLEITRTYDAHAG